MKVTISALVSIILTRAFVALAAMTPALQFIFEDRSYHLYYGLGLIILAVIFKSLKYRKIIFGIGAGLFIDDMAALKYLFTGLAVDPIPDYWSPLFIIPLLIGLLILASSEKFLQKRL
ncbi:MAG: hypothetical protein AAB373_00485 [Patescibacteria group bacterium]